MNLPKAKRLFLLLRWAPGRVCRNQDKRFVVSNADGNEASAMKNINDALKIRHPTTDPCTTRHRKGRYMSAE